VSSLGFSDVATTPVAPYGTPGYSSGTVNYGNNAGGGPLISELVLEAYERAGKIGIELTSQYIQSARRSLNLVLSSWANRGPNLWTVTDFSVYMPQGVGQYICPPQVINALEDSVVLRQYQMGAPVAVTPAFSTTLGSTSVTVSGLAATPSAGQYISVGVMTSVGGIIVDGFYQVNSVPGTGQAIITAAAAATSTATGGVVPQFVTTTNSSTVTINFVNHGLSVGQPFTVEVQTAVGGLTLLGPYPVASVLSSSQFTFTSPYPAGSGATVLENGGDTNLATQATTQGLTQTAYPVDIILYPISRGDWQAIPVKQQQGRPTTFWIDRQISPVFNIWPQPDAHGPYELRYKASCQVQDADITGGQTLNVPFRFLEAFTADLAKALSIKWTPERLAMLKQEGIEQWELAATEDREKVSVFVVPDLSGYFE
jgi:hypothetical protein